MDVLQCPECELRFLHADELEEHLRSDHPEFHLEIARATMEASAVLAAHRRQRRHRHPEPHPD